MNPPLVGVLGTKHLPGAANLDDPREALHIVPLDEALTSPWPTDAHVCVYQTIDTGQPAWPRLQKAILSKLRAAGADVVCPVIFLDYDNPGHLEWTGDQFDAWLLKLNEIAEDWPVAWAWSYLYTTRHGARLVYVLDHPVSPEDYEQHTRWLVNEFTLRGLAFDRAVSDWTRLFRLPFVKREGLPSGVNPNTWEDPSLEFHEGASEPLPVACLGKVGRAGVKSPKATLKDWDEPKPDDGECLEMLSVVNPDTGRLRKPDWLKEFQRRLKGRDCYDCLFRDKPLAEPGERDSTIMRYVGLATTLLYSSEEFSAERLYAMFLPPVLQLDPDDQTADWTDVLWKAIGYAITHEEAEIAHAELVKAQEEVDGAELMVRVLDGMKAWCKDPHITLADEVEAMEWAHARLIAAVGKQYHIMQPNGWYDSMGVSAEHLVSRIRKLRMDTLIDTITYSKDGQPTDVAAQKIINTHTTMVSSMRGGPGEFGGRITNIDRNDACLVVGLFHLRKDILPTFSKEVDFWLRLLFGEDFEDAQNWIGHALDFEGGPIAALSLAGPAGSGKKMLAQGLAECINTEALAGPEDLVSDYQYNLLRSPFLLVDEGFPRSRSKHPADTFRELVGGGTRGANQKYKAPIVITNPVRVMLTANNLDVVGRLTAGRDLSPDDREALSIRLLHYNLDDKASLWLRQKGGQRYTGQEGWRWIRGDGNADSDYVLAKHLLWIYENCRRPKAGRFLVEGNAHKTLFIEMRTQSGSAPQVIECIVKMVEMPKVWKGLVIEDNKLYVTCAEVLDFYRTNVQRPSRDLDIHKISSVFKGLCVTQPSGSTMMNGQADRKRWWEIDCRLLLAAAQREGWPAPRLTELVVTQEGKGKAGLVNRLNGAH